MPNCKLPERPRLSAPGGSIPGPKRLCGLVSGRRKTGFSGAPNLPGPFHFDKVSRHFAFPSLRPLLSFFPAPLVEQRRPALEHKPGWEMGGCKLKITFGHRLQIAFSMSYDCMFSSSSLPKWLLNWLGVGTKIHSCFSLFFRDVFQKQHLSWFQFPCKTGLLPMISTHISTMTTARLSCVDQVTIRWSWSNLVEPIVISNKKTTILMMLRLSLAKKRYKQGENHFTNELADWLRKNPTFEEICFIYKWINEGIPRNN